MAGAHYLAGFNLIMPSFDNKLARQALSYAVDKTRFVDTILGGVGAPEPLAWASVSPAYEAASNAQYAFDLDKAHALLNQAGVSALEFDYMAEYREHGNVGLWPHQSERPGEIGVKMNIQNYDGATWLDDVNARKFNGVYFAAGNYFNLSSGTAFTNGKAFSPDLNNSSYKSDTFVQLITTGATARGCRASSGLRHESASYAEGWLA